MLDFFWVLCYNTQAFLKKEVTIMIDKEIGEIRRHLRRERSNITQIFGCFVNDNKEIITEFR